MLGLAVSVSSALAAHSTRVPDAPACATGRLVVRPKKARNAQRATGNSPVARSVMLVEAGGIEPPSETESTAAATCVAHCLVSPSAGQWTACARTSLLFSHPRPADTVVSQPKFAIPSEPPWAGFSLSKACGN